MSIQDFAAHIEQVRERLNSERATLLNERSAIDEKLDEINREFAAIDAYESAKAGKQEQPVRRNDAPRARRGSRRESLMQIIGASPVGMSRGDILDHMGLKGDKAGEMSISNALTALTKSSQLMREGGKYFIPPDVSLQRAAE